MGWVWYTQDSTLLTCQIAVLDISADSFTHAQVPKALIAVCVASETSVEPCQQLRTLLYGAYCEVTARASKQRKE